MKPIWNHRQLVGSAATKQSAERYLKNILNLSGRAKLDVWERSADICEMNDLPSGFVYSVSYGVK
jgi:hypothetical protein